MQIAEVREQKLATAKKNLKLVVVALLVLAIDTSMHREDLVYKLLCCEI